MQKFVPGTIIFLLIFAWVRYQETVAPSASDAAPAAAIVQTDGRSAESVLAQAYVERVSNLQVTGSGRVVRVLDDDSNGDRHQRFILELASGQTLLVAHNIDLAPRIPGLAAGDRVGFSGEYEWNQQGGILHWTHHDPAGRHIGGWLEHGGRRYE
jgi:hypothetical protein